MKKKPIFITGLPRSGTSMIAGSLTSIGVWSGETIPGNSFNPKGYFENAVIRDKIVKPILMSHGFDPLGVRKLPPRDFCPKITVNHQHSLADYLHTVLHAQNYEEPQPWLYKDAKLSLIWRLLNSEFPNAIWVIVRRNRADFIQSCLNTDFMSQHSRKPEFWNYFADAIEERLEELINTVHCHYSIEANKVVMGQFDDLEEVCLCAGINFDKQKVEAFVDKNLMKKCSAEVAPDTTASSVISA